MKVITKKLFELPPKENNARNSEGDFFRFPDGRIMFAYCRFTGNNWDDNMHSDICAVYSDDGEHFDTENIVTLVRPERLGGHNAMCVTLRPCEKGVRLYFLIKKERDSENVPLRSEYSYIDSSDGVDFSGEAVLCLPKIKESYYVVNNNRVETLSSGRIIIPVAEHRATLNDGRYSYGAGIDMFIYSDDGGKTFNDDVQELSLPVEGDKAGLQEPGVIELPDGRLYGYFRTDMGYQYESFSCDNGKTWSDPVPSQFESPLSPMRIAKNPYSGKYYAIRNPYRERPESPEYPRFRNTWGRTPLAISESCDGIHFGDFELIESDLHYGYCYPAIYFLSENEALVSYCSGGVDIAPLQRTTVSKISFS